MQHLTTSLVIGLALFGAAVPARAQQNAAGDLDHLICYRMRDRLAVPARFDLLARLQPEFSRAGCALVLDHDDSEVNSEFCVPASKLNVQAPGHDPTIAGMPLADDYVCYRIECQAGARPPNKLVTDQFGRLPVRFGQPARICVPARKEPVFCGPTDTNSRGAPVCGGVCVNSGDRCQLNRRANACVCAPSPCRGRPDGAAMCGGSCANPADACVADDDNRCACAPRGCSPDPVSLQCGGVCAAGLECLTGANGACGCGVPSSPGCSLDPNSGSCGGECPDGLFCLPPVSGGDTCLCRSFGGLG